MGKSRKSVATPGNEIDAARIAELTGPLNVGLMFRDLHRAGRDLLKERIARHGISVGAWYYLWALYQEDGLGHNELARRVRNVGPTAVSALARMERDGLVTRVRSDEDRRLVQVFLTDLARELRPVLEREAAEVNQQSLALLDEDEVAMLIRILGKIGQALRV